MRARPLSDGAAGPMVRKLLLFGAALMTLWATPAISQADPSVLRTAPVGRGAALELGIPEASMGGWITPKLGVAVSTRWPGTFLGVSAGTRFALTEGPKGWGLHAHVAGGVVVPTVRPGFGLSFTPALLFGRRTGRGQLMGAVALPIATVLTGAPAARLPIVLELIPGGRIGPLWLGGRLGFGAVIASGQPLSFSVQASLVVGIDADRLPPRAAP